jgi:hypothetical protein
MPTPGADVLLRTATGERLHIAPCPHILGVATEVASAADRLALGVCSWCEKEINGVGRTYFDNLRDAMRFFGTHVGTEALIREALQGVDHDQIWIPYSRSYIALGRGGAGVAWVGKTYVVPARDSFLELPGYEAGSGGGDPVAEQFGDICETHHVARSLTGLCEYCD